jgi:hypothetical protein
VNYVLDIQLLIVHKFPEDGTLVPKHLGGGTHYFHDLFRCILTSLFVFLLKYGI